MVCYIFLVYVHYLFYKKVLREKEIESEIYDIKLILAVSTGTLVLMLVLVVVYRNILIRYFMVLMIVAVAIINRSKIKNILLAVKNKE